VPFLDTQVYPRFRSALPEMLKKIKSIIVHRIFPALGYRLTKIQKLPYEELKGLNRYEARTVKLLDKDFRIPDALSFRHSFKEIFEREIYKFNTSSAHPRILDCGANIGLSVIYFKKVFPNGRITAVECDPNILHLLKCNLIEQGLQDVIILDRAVSNSRETVYFAQEGADAGHVVEKSSPKEKIPVETILLDDLINEPIDFLKLDIEGCEVDALLACKKLNLVRNLFVEYHSFQDSPQRLGELLELLKANGFRFYISTQICPSQPLFEVTNYLGMDMQLNIFANRPL
jgi:FkbM family methyltransferase